MKLLIDNAFAVARAYWYLRKVSQLGKKVRVWGRPCVKAWGTMIIGDRVQVVSTNAIVELAVLPNGTLEIGEGTYINYGCSIAAGELIRIGARCAFGPYSMILDNNFHHTDLNQRQERPKSKPVILEDDVWLAARVIVLPGVCIGKGSVIGAGSVVTRSIPPGVLAAGNPARVIREIAITEQRS